MPPGPANGVGRIEHRLADLGAHGGRGLELAVIVIDVGQGAEHHVGAPEGFQVDLTQGRVRLVGGEQGDAQDGEGPGIDQVAGGRHAAAGVGENEHRGRRAVLQAVLQHPGPAGHVIARRQRFLRPVGLVQHRRQVLENGGIPVRGGDFPPDRGLGLRQPSGRRRRPHQGVQDRAARRRLRGGQMGQGLKLSLHGLVEPAHVQQHEAPVAVRQGEGRIEGDGAVDGRHGLGPPAQPIQHDRQIVLDEGQRRQRLRRPPQQGHGGLGLALAGPQAAEPVQADPVVRPQGQVTQQNVQRIRAARTVGQDRAQQAQGLGVTRIRPQDPSATGFSLAPAAGGVAGLGGDHQGCRVGRNSRTGHVAESCHSCRFIPRVLCRCFGACWLMSDGRAPVSAAAAPSHGTKQPAAD